ncbi:MAG: hypothetical protein QF809_02700 [Candidatus Peribacteraceae bacterium]|jgi:hypothetical protein|nr:hypothetical protein [Candidatus Peribacteraceae bacterium]MDP7645549.1 hypothetical protein [Candidatus Peribacteraceae bacterium]|tara:strand:+ start:687 stop:1472 length:786 start_codon:yes stop_codon:yes gene_type:complete
MDAETDNTHGIDGNAEDANSPSPIDTDDSGVRNLLSAESAETYGITFEDLLKLENGQVGLRHVSSEKRMQREASEGINNGDAVLLSNIRNQVPDNFIPVEISEIEKRFGMKIAVNNFKNNLSEAARRATEACFAKSLHRCVKSSINFNAVSPVQTGAQMIDLLLPKHAFLILRTGDLQGYDADAYGSFGKMGDRDIPKENIYVTISPQEIEEVWANTRIDYESKPLDPAFDKAIEDAVCKLIVQKIQAIEVPEPDEKTLLA